MFRKTHFRLALVLVALLNHGESAQAELWRDAPGKADLEAAEVQAALIGQPVFSDGERIGTVTAASIGEKGLIDKLRVRIPSHLGLGEREVDIPSFDFTVVTDAVVLYRAVEEFGLLPSVGDP